MSINRAIWQKVSQSNSQPPLTPDGRYIVVRGRLWRAADPALSAHDRQRGVDLLMSARREVRAAKGDAGRLAIARSDVQAAKEMLGERGPVWWSDGAPDYNRYLARNTPYAEWYAALERPNG